jgi:uncharacterized protein DUF732
MAQRLPGRAWRILGAIHPRIRQALSPILIPPHGQTISHTKESTHMFTTRFTKPVARAAIAAGAIGIAALLAAGTANAEAADDQYLGMLAQQGIGFGTPESAVTVAHHVCDALGQGMEPSEISQHIAAANSRIDGQTALVITVDAALSYCPQFTHDMGDGRTVVGPAR